MTDIRTIARLDSLLCAYNNDSTPEHCVRDLVGPKIRDIFLEMYPAEKITFSITGQSATEVADEIMRRSAYSADMRPMR